jgi:hypothetical protein
MRTLSVRISSWRVRSVHASVPDPYAQGTHQSWCVFSACFEGTALCHALVPWRICSVHAPVPDSYAQRSISSWHASSACARVPDPYAQRAHKGRSMRVRNSVFSIIFKVPKTAKILKNRYGHQQMDSKASRKRKKNSPNSKKSLLNIRLSICVRNFAAPNEPLNIYIYKIILTPKSASLRDFMV